MMPPMDGGSELANDTPDELAEDEPSETAPRVGVYAAAAGLATAVPLPFADRVLSGLARGAALRRVAKRHGVRLTRGARDILSGGRVSQDPKGRWLRSAISSALAPLRIASRVDDAVSTWAAAILLDHHLTTAERPRGAPLSRDEAVAIRHAMDSAEVHAVLEALRLAPSGVARAIGDALRAAVELDTEDRSPVERAVDTLLDAAADSPESILERLRGAFDHAMRQEDES
jgi:hypothetical protein